MRKKPPLCVLVSGGLDSSVLLAALTGRHRSVWPIYVRQGLRWESTELYWLRRFLRRIHSRSLRPLEVLSLPMGDLYRSHWSTGRKSVPGARSRDAAVFLPGRNLALSLKAAVFAASRGIRRLALGSLDHNPFPDVAPRFFAFASLAHYHLVLTSLLPPPSTLIQHVENLCRHFIRGT